LRWKVTPGEYVECYEHRVEDGRVTTASQVHHRNGIRSDNRPENLERVTIPQHGERHRRVDWTQIARDYAAGDTTTQIAARYGLNSGTVSRIVRAEGVPTRRPRDYETPVDEADLRRLCAEPDARVPGIAAALGVSEAVVRARMDRYGIAAFRVGRPAHPREAAARGLLRRWRITPTDEEDR
jgi:hypothetical protein